MATKPTIQDIADRAGVGRSTVSRVLNDHPYVSEEVRTRVQRAMEELDYRPSFSARHMRTNRSQLIGFIADEVATAPYAGDIIRGAQDAAWERGFILLTVSAGTNFKIAHAAVEAMLEREVEGIIYSAMYHHVVHLPPAITSVPTVLADCFVPDRSVASVVPDEFNAGQEASEYLLRAGHQRIGFINVNTLESGIPAAIGRLEGYKAALEAYDIPFDDNLVRFGDGTPASGYAYTLDLLTLRHRPTAIFCGNDRMAMGAYDALRENGVRIPDDMAMIGFDNQEIIAAALRPPLTTMQLPHYQMGQWAVEYLLRVIDEPESRKDAALQHMLPCPLVERVSV